MLRTRILTAIVLLALIAGAGLASPAALHALAWAFFALAMLEWLRLAGSGPRVAMAGCVALYGLGMGVEAAGLFDAIPVRFLSALSVALWLVIVFHLVRVQRGAPLAVPLPLSRLLAPLLTGIAALALTSLLRQGLVWTLSALALVWVADIAAYFTGRAFGRSKLADRISPGKTWAGVWGAIGAVALLCLAAWAWWPQARWPLWPVALLRQGPLTGAAVLALAVVLSIAGDLFESLVKRQAGAKDSGRLLPGHGGVWDRIDALLPVLPLALLASFPPGGLGIHG